MNKSQVRCWKLKNFRPSCIDELLITYPEDNFGHNLITCLCCGKVYSVSVTDMIYIGPTLEVKLAKTNCAGCGRVLVGNYDFYPDYYLSHGTVISFARPRQIPPDDESLVVTFDEIY